ncbi:MAG: hypothetical protein IPG54_14920 [Sphingomonadales bacterium]|jgi:hypothetical protein|nr:hypothetical protein [Sphingomonadales bacterium]MBK9005185.1 hypothetical protein [Sphingomonadales bacterium]MBK9267081.1 hypothetical protein [Sphingomonadales bacterium]MBP6434141.1 hypothetical protein [Sphingorhabdus sp.]
MSDQDIDMGPQKIGDLSIEESRAVRARQAGRARAMAVVLFGLCALFFAITIVKVGVWG